MPPIPAPPVPAAAVPARYAKEAETAPHAFEPPPRPPAPMQAIMRAPAPSASGEIEISVQQPLPTSPAPLPKHQRGNPFEPATNGAPPPMPPAAAPFAPMPHARRPPTSPMVPHPRDVLDALALSGVFEPPTERSVAAAAWANANRGPSARAARPSSWAWCSFSPRASACTSSIATSAREEHLQAEAVLDNVEAQLHAGKPGPCPTWRRRLPRPSSSSRAVRAAPSTGRASGRSSAS